MRNKRRILLLILAPLVAGGRSNTASGLDATVAGGFDNSAEGQNSFAAGRSARALHNGAFVWSSGLGSPPAPFESTDDEQFLIRAEGGVGINTNDPGAALELESELANGDTVRVRLGSAFRSMEAIQVSPDGTVLSSAFLVGDATDNAALFVGDVGIQGDLSVSGTKNFRIDHPLDPENKVLHHFAVESNEVLNVYSGTALLDDEGHAVIALPDYFEALNTDFRYQLTPVGAAMPNLHIAERVTDNEFEVAGGEPGEEVSWEVTAVRDDPAVHASKVPVEMEKPADEDGTSVTPAVAASAQE